MSVIASLMAWIVLVTGFQNTMEEPNVVLVPHSFFVQRSCDGIDTEQNPCEYAGLYVYKERTIYINNALAKDDFDALLVHELTHYLQHVNAKWTKSTCVDKILRERQAYKIQQRYITEVQKRDKTVTPPSDEEVCAFN